MMDWFSLYLQYLGYGVGIGTAYVALLLFASAILRRPDLEARAKHEVVQILITVFLLPVLFIALDGAFSHLAAVIDPVGHQAVCTSPPQGTWQGCHFLAAKYFLQELLREELWLLSQSYIATNALQILNSLSMSSNNLQGGVGAMVTTSHPYAGLTDPQVVEMKVVDSWAYRAFQVTAFLLAFFQYIEGAFPTLLGVGLILRIFPLARKVGGLILAIALALYFIFPLPLLVGADIYHSISPQEVAREPGTNNPIYMRLAKISLDLSHSSTLGEKVTAGSIKGYVLLVEGRQGEARQEWESSVEELEEKKQDWKDYMGQALQMLVDAPSNVGEFVFDRLKTLVASLIDIFHFVASTTSFIVFTFFGMFTEDYFYRYYFEVASSFITISIIAFYVGTISAIAFVKQFSPMLGGDVEIGGLTHLV